MELIEHLSLGFGVAFTFQNLVSRVRHFQASEFVHPQWNQSLSGVI